jgi:hypothetical protein
VELLTFLYALLATLTGISVDRVQIAAPLTVASSSSEQCSESPVAAAADFAQSYLLALPPSAHWVSYALPRLYHSDIAVRRLVMLASFANRRE